MVIIVQGELQPILVLKLLSLSSGFFWRVDAQKALRNVYSLYGMLRRDPESLYHFQRTKATGSMLKGSILGRPNVSCRIHCGKM
ncbi:hypothetical protein NPIL_469371 [Nephila pilipes]|uniref:Uncharacterized protein n=1 Tax=Nephila pilipes TaxID=299642 RepID=A0A8X6PYQ7_NEPPI|nr:hypothetical protein NPIL_469371 [Nephila pilipes]